MMKICSNPDCVFLGKPQPISSFKERAANKDGHEGRCRACRRIIKNKQEARYRKKPNHYCKSDRFKESRKRYRQSPQGKLTISVNAARRYARTKNLPDNFTKQDWIFCLDYWGGCCAICGQSADFWHIIAIDHWIPLASPICPGTIPENIIPLCHSKEIGMGGCNNSKHSQDPLEWLTKTLGEQKATQVLKRVKTYFELFKH